MKCMNCGWECVDTETVCPGCGAPLNAKPAAADPTVTAPIADRPMKWYKFLIYFGLFAGAVLNFVNLVRCVNGNVYGGKEMKEMVYAMLPFQQTVDVVFIICLAGLIALAIVARFALAKYKKNGPFLLNALYIATAATNLINFILTKISWADMPYNAELDGASVAISIIVAVAMLGINHVYFQKRADLFINE